MKNNDLTKTMTVSVKKGRTHMKHVKWLLPTSLAVTAAGVPLGFGIYALANPKSSSSLKMIKGLKEFEQSIANEFKNVVIGGNNYYLPNMDYIKYITQGESAGTATDELFRLKYPQYEDVVEKGTFKFLINPGDETNSYWINENESNNPAIFNHGYNYKFSDLINKDIIAYLEKVNADMPLPFWDRNEETRPVRDNSDASYQQRINDANAALTTKLGTITQLPAGPVPTAPSDSAVRDLETHEPVEPTNSALIREWEDKEPTRDKIDLEWTSKEPSLDDITRRYAASEPHQSDVDSIWTPKEPQRSQFSEHVRALGNRPVLGSEASYIQEYKNANIYTPPALTIAPSGVVSESDFISRPNDYIGHGDTGLAGVTAIKIIQPGENGMQVLLDKGVGENSVRLTHNSRESYFYFLEHTIGDPVAMLPGQQGQHATRWTQSDSRAYLAANRQASNDARAAWEQAARDYATRKISEVQSAQTKFDTDLVQAQKDDETAFNTAHSTWRTDYDAALAAYRTSHDQWLQQRTDAISSYAADHLQWRTGYDNAIASFQQSHDTWRTGYDAALAAFSVTHDNWVTEHNTWEFDLHQAKANYRSAYFQFQQDLAAYNEQVRKHNEEEALAREVTSQQIKAINDQWEAEKIAFAKELSDWQTTGDAAKIAYFAATGAQVNFIRTDSNSPFNANHKLYGEMVYGLNNIFGDRPDYGVNEVYEDLLDFQNGASEITEYLKFVDLAFGKVLGHFDFANNPDATLASIPYFIGVTDSSEISFEYQIAMYGDTDHNNIYEEKDGLSANAIALLPQALHGTERLNRNVQVNTEDINKFNEDFFEKPLNENGGN